ncbi:hypothetical protein GA0070622_0899 [Micromonospora sediminicola]|uniref:Uncharacterized protein n=1 Tax=Micromonospora sediminicola TaxID=946078 RepID=A0A1A9B4E7_9ACTN|nr:hypothetical protein [Micromonospora sediminicola]SBT63931.1 hypothetical protein GA0070622_0899 [Micromonospora sediminicola]
MAKAKDKEQYVVTAGYVTVETQVGAGRALVDVPHGAPLPDDVSDEQRQRLLDAGAISLRDGDGDVDASAETDGPTNRFGTPAARPVPGLVEPDEIDRDVIVAGAAEDILDWVGEDLARARVALDMEQAKGLNTRQGLVVELQKVMGGQETEPPAVPEALVDDGTVIAPATPGGVAVPDPDPLAGGAGDSASTPAKATKATAAAKASAAKATKATGSSRG